MHPHSTEPTPATITSQRDAHGRFARGNLFGRGNPFARQTAALRKAAAQVVTEQDAVEIMHAAMIRAKSGDIAAAKFVFSYAIGRPAEAPDPDRLDLEEWQILQQSVVGLQELQRVRAGCHLDFVHAYVAPAVHAETLNQVAHMEAGFAQRQQQREQAAAAEAAAPSATRDDGGRQEPRRPGTERGRPSGDGHDGRASGFAPAEGEDEDKARREPHPAYAGGAGCPPPSADGGNGVPAWAQCLLEGPDADDWRELLALEDPGGPSATGSNGFGGGLRPQPRR